MNLNRATDFWPVGAPLSLLIASGIGAGLCGQKVRQHDEGLDRLQLQAQRPQEGVPRGPGVHKAHQLQRPRLCAEKVVGQVGEP